MFTLKCAKPNGIMHVYEVTGYTIHPPEKNKSDEMVTVVDGWTGDGHVTHHVCRDSDVFYREIYIENATGKTIDVIRGAKPCQNKRQPSVAKPEGCQDSAVAWEMLGR